MMKNVKVNINNLYAALVSFNTRRFLIHPNLKLNLTISLPYLLLQNVFCNKLKINRINLVEEINDYEKLFVSNAEMFKTLKLSKHEEVKVVIPLKAINNRLGNEIEQVFIKKLENDTLSVRTVIVNKRGNLTIVNNLCLNAAFLSEFFISQLEQMGYDAKKGIDVVKMENVTLGENYFFKLFNLLGIYSKPTTVENNSRYIHKMNLPTNKVSQHYRLTLPKETLNEKVDFVNFIKRMCLVQC